VPRGVHPRGNDARCVVEISGERKNSLKLCIRECNVQSATIKEHWNAASEVTTLRRYSNLFIVIIIITITQWKGGISVWWSRTSYASSAWGGFLTGQQINRINVFFVKYDVLVFVPPDVFVMYRNILASLIVNCSRVHKARATACLTYFHLRRTSVVYILEDMVTSFPYISIVFVKKIFPTLYFILS